MMLLLLFLAKVTNLICNSNIISVPPNLLDEIVASKDVPSLLIISTHPGDSIFDFLDVIDVRLSLIIVVFNLGLILSLFFWNVGCVPLICLSLRR